MADKPGRFAERVLDRLERLVERIEADCRAEVVLVLAHRSARYRELAWAVAAVAGLVALLALVYSPLPVQAEWLPLDVVLVAALAWVLVRWLPATARLLTTRARRRAEVERSAGAVYAARGVSLTRERTGLLVYLSWLERELVILPDVGIERAVPRSEWNEACRALCTPAVFAGFPEALEQAFEPLRALLARYLPAQADNPDEIPNRPVVLE